MLMSCIGTLIFCLVEILAFPSQNLDVRKTTSVLIERQEPSQPYPSNKDTSKAPSESIKRPDPDTTSVPRPGSESESCEKGNCSRAPPNLVAIIVGSLCGVLLIALITVLIIWFCSRRRQQKRKEPPMTPAVKFIEYPALYTGATSTADSTSRLYGMSVARNDSISSHHYEKINYNERS